MSSIFVDKNKTFDIDIFIGFAKSDPDLIFVDENEVELKKQSEDISKIEKHTLSFRFYSYGDSLKILDSVSFNDNLDINLSNIGKIRKARLEHLIKSWSFVDNNGSPIQINKENIDNLHPLIAAMINIMLEKKLSEKGLL